MQDWENEHHLAAGIGYEIGWGEEVIYNNTDELRIWISENKSFGKLHLGATVNYLIAINQSQGAAGSSDMLTFHFHSDYYLAPWISPVFEVNGYVVTNDNGSGVSGLSGIDAVSLGSGEDKDVWTAAIGAELRPFENNISIRAAFERAISSNTDIFDSRWTFSAVYPF
jgi:hypothetical protein